MGVGGLAYLMAKSRHLPDSTIPVMELKHLLTGYFWRAESPKRTRGSPPDANPEACPALPLSGTDQASPAATPPPLTPLGLEHPRQPTFEEVRVVGA